MVTRGQIRKGAYYDSVSLMTVGKELSTMPGVKDAALVMGTRENLGILERSGLLLDEFSGVTETDLLAAVLAGSVEEADAVLARIDELLEAARKQDEGESTERPWSLDGALKVLPDANLALISVAGRYAAQEAMKALEKGLHVMLFSDNVSLEEEVSLKQFAQTKGLLVMGPDCGTAIINGVPLAFANVVKRGDIGVVAASGTGLQEVTVLISNAGAGISQAIGTGGRDVKKEVGGLMFLAALEALAADPQTKVIVLVSKPPSPEVLERIRGVTGRIKKPVVSFFLGADAGARTLEEAALQAVALSRGGSAEEVPVQLARRNEELKQLAAKAAARLKPEQRYVRGLFSGGTFCTEAQVLFGKMLPEVYANSPTGSAKKLDNALKSRGHTVVDLGEDEFTVGRPHPMIDFSLRNARIREEADDPVVAVILLDVVLGYGANMNPADELREVVEYASGRAAVVCSITGTDQDPQNRRELEAVLTGCGALVLPSNAAACLTAGYIIQKMGA